VEAGSVGPDSGQFPSVGIWPLAALVGPTASVAWGVVLGPALASGQWSVVSGQSPAAGVPTGLQVGSEPMLVVQGLDHDHRSELSPTGPDDGRVLDSTQADLVTDADPSRGEGAAGTSGVRVRPGAGDVEGSLAPGRIPVDRTDPTDFAGPVELPVPPVEGGLIRPTFISDAAPDELAVVAVGWTAPSVVPADPIVVQERPRESAGGLAKLAATLIVAGSRGYRAHSRGVTRRKDGTGELIPDTGTKGPGPRRSTTHTHALEPLAPQYPHHFCYILLLPFCQARGGKNPAKKVTAGRGEAGDLRRWRRGSWDARPGRGRLRAPAVPARPRQVLTVDDLWGL
jgi:hypothetical protein